jgi:uncharacterized protein YndB with AHSA1/START domain
MTSAPLPPIERSIDVSWNQQDAFRRFAVDFGAWWPWRTHSIGGPRVRRVVLEPAVGGRIYEEHTDGRRFQWGRVLEWEPPRRLKFTFHPSRASETAQDVEVRFDPMAAGTRVVLTAAKWENWGKGAQAARRGYGVGWGYVLNVWVGRRTPRMRIMDAVIALANLVALVRGGRAAEIARAKGEIEAATNGPR